VESSCKCCLNLRVPQNVGKLVSGNTTDGASSSSAQFRIVQPTRNSCVTVPQLTRNSYVSNSCPSNQEVSDEPRPYRATCVLNSSVCIPSMSRSPVS
jgi:hypothetical protein